MSVRRAQDERIEGTPDGNTAITEISDVPDAPTIGAIADPGPDGSASVAFTAAATGGTVTTYTATSTPGTITGTSATSPITVTGLTLDTAYTFKVKGTNSTATGPESSASSSFTPTSHESYYPISTTTLTTTASSITFSSIPSTYTHLQIRLTARSTRAGALSQFKLNFNSDTGSNYADHYLLGSGASAASGFDGASQTYLWGSPIAANSTLANTFGSGVVDILDYTNTNKYKTIRALGGIDENGGGYVGFISGVWMSSSAITSITIGDGYGANFTQYTNATLYGIKGA